MFHCEVDKTDYVFKQDDAGSCFFLFEKGKLSVIINNPEKKELSPGDGTTLYKRLRRPGAAVQRAPDGLHKGGREVAAVGAGPHHFRRAHQEDH